MFKQKDLNFWQRRWLELLKDYDITILYHPGKVSVVAGALSRKAESLSNLVYLPVVERPLALDVQVLANQFFRLDIFEPSKFLSCMVSQSSLYDRIRERHYDDPHLLVLKDTVQHSDAKCHEDVSGLKATLLLEADEESHSGGCSSVPKLSAGELAQVYIREILRLHDVLVSIISDQGTQSALRF
ncbi:uncharacterized protein [Nicotiana tomentosiformis]|uniref:uncharacterized protein n=1 Tax=Nicotiana tomentosiformis TaxID=4098 RepID=UPI00388CD238